MKTISDATGIAGKRGVRIPIPRQPEAPESDIQPEAPGLTPARASGSHAPEGAKILCGTLKFVFGASFERRCVFVFGSFGSNDNIFLNGQEFVSYLIEVRKVNLLIKRHTSLTVKSQACLRVRLRSIRCAASRLGLQSPPVIAVQEAARYFYPNNPNNPSKIGITRQKTAKSSPGNLLRSAAFKSGTSGSS